MDLSRRLRLKNRLCLHYKRAVIYCKLHFYKRENWHKQYGVVCIGFVASIYNYCDYLSKPGQIWPELRMFVCCYTRSNHLTNGNMCVQRSGYFKRRVKYYNNCTACFSFGKIRLIGIHPIPGPDSGNVKKFRIRGLYLNARSLVNKTAELQALAVDADMIAVTESWLKPDISNTCRIIAW